MSPKRTKYTSAFKTKLVLEVLQNESTLVQIAGGMVYMAAIIDWHSKAVLAHAISNTMDSQLVMKVLNDALEKHPHP
ncbi:MAG: transposase family protein, partial [Gammaproteobacteria bacterium]|nr:transposase family protein [Gammaproteobacteria bacterium]